MGIKEQTSIQSYAERPALDPSQLVKRRYIVPDDFTPRAASEVEEERLKSEERVRYQINQSSYEKLSHRERIAQNFSRKNKST